MKYIDKSINEAAGRGIIDTFLKDCWDNSEACYKGADYDGLCRPTYRSVILPLMLNEQSNLCCYCLRKIVITDTTLEHIIPNKIKEIDFDSYLVTDELTKNVIHKNVFDKNSKAIPPELYPHDVAYHNLIASCNSKSHCNHYRGDKKIEPLIFDRNIETLVEYDRAGNAYCLMYETDLQTLGLSKSKSPLKLIRMIWYELAQTFTDVNDVSSEKIDEIIYALILDDDGTGVIDNFTGEPSYKDDILKYKWFFNYYHRV